MSKLKVGEGPSNLERNAIDARLERLGVTVEPDRTVSEEDAKGSKVKGGFEGLSNAAQTTGAGNVIDVTDLSAIQGRTTFSPAEAIRKVRGKDAETLAHASLSGAALTLEGAAESLRAIAERATTYGRLDSDDFARAARLINHAPAQLRAAVSDGALAFASAEELTRLKQAYSGFLSSFAKHAVLFETLTNKHILPTIEKIVDDHNARGFGRLLTGASALAAVSLGEDLLRVSQSIDALLGFKDLFAFNGKPISEGPPPPPPEPTWFAELKTGDSALDKAVQQINDWSEQCYSVGHLKHKGRELRMEVLGEGAILFEGGLLGAGKAKPIDVFDYQWDAQGAISLTKREGSTGAFDKLPDDVRESLAQAATAARKTNHFM